MWITLNDEEINFDLIFRYKRVDNSIWLTDLNKESTIIYYKSEDKAKQVMRYLKKTLNKLGYTEEDKET